MPYYEDEENYSQGVPYHESSVDDFHEDSFWADFTYDYDGEDPFEEYDDLAPEWD